LTIEGVGLFRRRRISFAPSVVSDLFAHAINEQFDGILGSEANGRKGMGGACFVDHEDSAFDYSPGTVGIHELLDRHVVGAGWIVPRAGLFPDFHHSPTLTLSRECAIFCKG
jgi:hypothetical protein